MRGTGSHWKCGELVRGKAWLAWSSGKDSAWALHTVRQSAEFEVVALLTTVNQAYSRVAMHAVRESLLEMQADAAGLPLIKVPIPSACTNEIYEQAMSDAMTRARAGVSGAGAAASPWRVMSGPESWADCRTYRAIAAARWAGISTGRSQPWRSGTTPLM